MSIILEPLLKLGQLMAVIPVEAATSPATVLQQILAISLLCFITWGTSVWILHSATIFPIFTIMKISISTLHHLVMGLFIAYIFVALPFFKRARWFKLLKRIRRLTKPSDGTIRRAILTILLLHLAFIGIYDYTYFSVKSNYPEVTTGDFFNVVLQANYRFFYTLLLWVLLKIILDAYVDLGVRLEERVTCHKLRDDRVVVFEDDDLVALLRDIESRYYSLNKCVDLLNELFGWPLLLTTFYSTLYTLDYVDDFYFYSDRMKRERLIGIYVSNIVLILVNSAQYLVLALLCNSIVETARRIFMLAHTLYRILELGPGDRVVLGEFVSSGFKQLPEFSAAGYFTVNKFNVATNFWMITTFLVIMFQFDTTLPK